MAGQPRYKTELYIPIKKDNQTFEQRQKSIWDVDRQPETRTGVVSDVHSNMDMRRREWEEEIERMRKDFFQLKPDDRMRDTSDSLFNRMNIDDFFWDDPRKQGQKRFQLGFDVREFRPEEVSVRTQENKLIVHAKHEERGQGHSVSKEFSRQVDIPPHVDPNSLSCVYTQDGVLQIEAPVTAPTYKAIRDTYTTQQQMSPPHQQMSPPHQQVSPSQQPMTVYHTGGAVAQTDGTKKLKMAVEIGRDYRPDEVLVKTVDRKLVVTAKHEERSAGHSSSKTFSREYDLPANVDPNMVTATLGDDGILTVEAPVMPDYGHGTYSVPVRSAPRQPTRIGVTIRKVPRN